MSMLTNFKNELLPRYINGIVDSFYSYDISPQSDIKTSILDDLHQIKTELFYHFYQFKRGVSHGLRLSFIKEKIKDETIKDACYEATKLGVGLFLASIIIYNFILLPLLEWSCRGTNCYLFKFLFETIWCMTWLFPSYCMTILYSNRYFDKIANAMLKEKKHKRENSSSNSILITISENKITLSLLMALVTGICVYIPYIGKILSFFLNSWHYAYYSFEYRWNYSLQKSSSKFLPYIHYYWSYFLGFGAALSLVTLPFSTTTAFGIYSFLFPYYLIMTFHKDTTPEDKELPKPRIIHTIRIFAVPEYINKHILINFFSRFKWKRLRNVEKH